MSRTFAIIRLQLVLVNVGEALLEGVLRVLGVDVRGELLRLRAHERLHADLALEGPGWERKQNNEIGYHDDNGCFQID